MRGNDVRIPLTNLSPSGERSLIRRCVYTVGGAVNDGYVCPRR
jgi:hypothetical protein